MMLQARPYHNPGDIARMRQLLMAGTQAGVSASYMHPGYLNWSIHFPPDEQANQRNLLLWERTDTGQPTLEAWAIYSNHEGTFDLFVSPALYGSAAHAAVMDSYMAWATARAREVGQAQLIPFWVFEYDSVMIGLLRAHGFTITQTDPPPPLFERTLDTLPAFEPPAGFSIQAVHTDADGQLRAAITRAAFRPNTDWDVYWAEYRQFIGSAVYAGANDLFVRAPDGRGASCCTIWFDPVNAVGLFEPVATHPDFQGQGLGKVVMAEGLRRMQAAGMRKAIIGFDPNNNAARALYSAMGFQAACYFVVCQKDM